MVVLRAVCPLYGHCNILYTGYYQVHVLVLLHCPDSRFMFIIRIHIFYTVFFMYADKVV